MKTLNKTQLLCLIFLLFISVPSFTNSVYFELKDDDERCFYDEYYYLNVI